ncbi:unnamed protein product [Soboliphyme baturini]|uniref:Vacuolar protein sorting-associated protein 13B n=1 Tax=Soboliphyme baturini TaxID=241478 RepID=A0A183J7J5_9BILA|nr:unnamed protein product [Soboliphyme baturini]
MSFDISAENAEIHHSLDQHSTPVRRYNESTLSLSSELSSPLVRRLYCISVYKLCYIVLSEERPWYCLLWPQPHQMYFPAVTHGAAFSLPERKLRIYFYARSAVPCSEMISLWRTCETYIPKIHGVQTELEFAYDVTVAFPDKAYGALWCGVFPHRFKERHSYSIRVMPNNVELMAADMLGLKYAINTFLQAVNLCATSSSSSSPLQNHSTSVPMPVQLPCLKINDWPDFTVRAVLLEFTGCRVFNLDTLRLLCSQMSYLKCSHLIISFEVRVQDKFSLPYSSKDLFQLKQYCRSLTLEVIPSLDINSRDVDTSVAFTILSEFLEKFYVLCLRASALSDQDLLDLALLHSPICLTLPSGRPGFLCSSLDHVLKTQSTLCELLHRCNVLGIIICDMSSGCELVAPVVNLTSKLAVLGLCWNRDVDFKSYAPLLPTISAVNVASDNLMETLFQEILKAGAIEYALTLKALQQKGSTTEPDGIQLFALSIPMELLLNPDNIDLDSFSFMVKTITISIRAFCSLFNVFHEAFS